jgi:hypothetical protein
MYDYVVFTRLSSIRPGPRFSGTVTMRRRVILTSAQQGRNRIPSLLSAQRERSFEPERQCALCDVQSQIPKRETGRLQQMKEKKKKKKKKMVFDKYQITEIPPSHHHEKNRLPVRHSPPE